MLHLLLFLIEPSIWITFRDAHIFRLPEFQYGTMSDQNMLSLDCSSEHCNFRTPLQGREQYQAMVAHLQVLKWPKSNSARMFAYLILFLWYEQLNPLCSF